MEAGEEDRARLRHAVAVAIPELTGFVDDQGNAMGRPVGVAVDKRGALLVADNVGDAVWLVSGPAGPR